MWCMIASPLILGNDLRNISKETLAIITNKEAIAINQDALGIQGTLMYEQSPGLQVWMKKLTSKNNIKYAIALLNRSGTAAEILLDFSKLGLPPKVKIRDVWTHEDLGKFENKYTGKVPAHGVQMLIVQY